MSVGDDAARVVDAVASVLAGAAEPALAAAAIDMSNEQFRRLLASVGAGDPVMVPVSLDGGRVTFLDMNGSDLAEPFFEDSAERIRRERTPPGPIEFELPLGSLLMASKRRGSPPDGLIFQAGRCGSTLLANLLAACGRYVVVKEPPLLTSLVARRLLTADEDRARQTDTLVLAALGLLASTARRAAHGRTRCIVKPAAWNVRLGRLLLEGFPTTPAVFLYREPLETVASLLAQRPGWFDLLAGQPPSTQALFFPTVPAEQTAHLSPLELFAHAWSSAVDEALHLPADRTLLVSYEALVRGPLATLSAVLSHLGDRPAGTLEAVRATIRYYSKGDGEMPFDPSRAHHRPLLKPHERTIVETITERALTRLRPHCV